MSYSFFVLFFIEKSAIVNNLYLIGIIRNILIAIYLFTEVVQSLYFSDSTKLCIYMILFVKISFSLSINAL